MKASASSHTGTCEWPGALVTRDAMTHVIIEEKHPFTPLFCLSSSLDCRLLSPYAFFGCSYRSFLSSCSPVSFDQISSAPLPHTYLCPPALSHVFDLGIVLWFHVTLIHSCVSICSSSLSFLTLHQPRQLVMNQAELQTAVIAECTKHKEQNSLNADYQACVNIGTDMASRGISSPSMQLKNLSLPMFSLICQMHHVLPESYTTLSTKGQCTWSWNASSSRNPLQTSPQGPKKP